MSNEIGAREMQLLLALLQNRDPHREGIEAVKGCEHIALMLRDLIWKVHGEVEARRIFMQFGWPPGVREAGTHRIVRWLRKLNASKQQYIDDGNFLFDLEISKKSDREYAREIMIRERIDFDTAHQRVKRIKRRYRRTGGDIIKR